MREQRGTLGTLPQWAIMDSAEMLSRAFRQEAQDSERAQLLSEMRSEFLARSTSRDSATLPRQATSKNVDGPTDAEFTKYTDPVSKKRWQATPTAWKCPICERSKRQILRKSNKGKWSGGIRQHVEYVEETDADTIEKRTWLFPDFQNEYWIKGTRTIHICSDCSGVGGHVAQQDRSLGEPYLKLQDLQDCVVESAPHRRHEIDVDLTRQRIAQNAAYWSAVAALNAYKNLLSKFHHKMEWWSKGGIAQSEILADLCEDLRVYHHISDAANQKALVAWILKQKQHASDDE